MTFAETGRLLPQRAPPDAEARARAISVSTAASLDSLSATHGGLTSCYHRAGLLVGLSVAQGWAEDARLSRQRETDSEPARHREQPANPAYTQYMHNIGRNAIMLFLEEKLLKRL